MKRVIVNVSTGRYAIGAKRMASALNDLADGDYLNQWIDKLPPGSPSHEDTPYAFKAYALRCVWDEADMVLWLDASIVPVRTLGPLWSLIAKQGYWFSSNESWNNGQWCSDAALPLFGITRPEAFRQRHVVSGAFGLNLRSKTGSAFLGEFIRFASNGAFRGPWRNDRREASSDSRVLGHRHDQTAASVIAHRLKMKLTDAPDWFAYRGGETEQTVLVADGAY